MGIVSRIRTLLDGDPSVRKVADDPALTAELLLLFRMILADGKVSKEEMATFRRICREAFGLEEKSLGEVMRYLGDVGYETNSGQALQAFAEMDFERRRMLARHMAEIAKADATLDGEEVRLMKRLLAILGLRPEDALDR